MVAKLPDGMRRRLEANGAVLRRFRRSVRYHVADVFAVDPGDKTSAWGALLDDVVLVVDELVANAVRNTCASDGVVEVDTACVLPLPGVRQGAVRICVWDDNPEPVPNPPEQPDPDDLAEMIDDLSATGRGLLIARMCVLYLDVVPDDSWGGKWVRAVMSVSADSRSCMGDRSTPISEDYPGTTFSGTHRDFQ
jgi:anti-sigma regulatory factor (Ser/Thr protein kinase)